MTNFPISLTPPTQPAFPSSPPATPVGDFDILIPPPTQAAFRPLKSPTSPAFPPRVDDVLAGLNAYQLAVIGAEGVEPFEGTLAEWLLSLHGDGAPSDTPQLWIRLASGWTEEPALNATTPNLGGEVYDYVFGPTTYYRHVPNPYDPTLDAFYETYSGGVLTTRLAAKGLVI